MQMHGTIKPRLAWLVQQWLFLVASTPTPTMLVVRQTVFVTLLSFGIQPVFDATSTAV